MGLPRLTFGTIEFGHFFFVKNTLQGAARESARAAVAGARNARVTSSVNESQAAAGFHTANYTITIRNAADKADVNVATFPTN